NWIHQVGLPIWQSNTKGTNVSLQDESGLFVLNNATPSWSVGSTKYGPEYMTLLPGGNFATYVTADQYNTYNSGVDNCGILAAGSSLDNTGPALKACNGQSSLALSEGDLELTNTAGSVLWHTSTSTGTTASLWDDVLNVWDAKNTNLFSSRANGAIRPTGYGF